MKDYRKLYFGDGKLKILYQGDMLPQPACFETLHLVF